MNTDSRKLQKLLDDIEDAEVDLTRYRRQLAFGVFSTTLGIAIVIVGVAVGIWGATHDIDVAGWVGALVMPGVFLAVASGIAVCLFVADHHGVKHVQVRRAQRAYRDYLTEE